MTAWGQNKRRDNFLNTLPLNGIEDSKIGGKCSFNFSYFSPDKGGQEWSQWNNDNAVDSLSNLMVKVSQFTAEPLSYWEHQKIKGGRLNILEYYGPFPEKSKFERPRCVPHDARWGRFRLSAKVRLVGFSVPAELIGKTDVDNNRLCKNIFYVVFLDKDHEFWPTKRKK